MESGELQDEIGAIEAIYPDCLEKLAPLIYKFKIPQHEHITVQMSFPETYPDESPYILDVLSNKEGFDEEYLTDLFQEVLESIYNEGIVCIFDFFTEIDQVLYTGEEDAEAQEDHWNADDNVAAWETTNDEMKEISDKLETASSSDLVEDLQATKEYTYDEEKEKAKAEACKEKKAATNLKESELDTLKGWFISEPIVDRKSTFVAFAKEVHSVSEAYESLDLLKCDRKVARAAHSMTAWRIRNDDTGVQYQDCDDDGETAAGGRMLHLLTIMDAWNVMVVVSRWFGGIHIGPDRFKHINAAAREAVIKGGFVVIDNGNGSKKSRKKK